MNGFYTDRDQTILPYFEDSGSLRGLLRQKTGKTEDFALDGVQRIPFTDIKPSVSAIKEHTHIPNSGSIQKLNREFLSRTNVPETCKAVEAFLRQYITLSEDGYKVAACYVISSWMPDCYQSIPHLLITCPNAQGNAQVARDVIGSLLPHVPSNKAKDMMLGAEFGLTLVGDLTFSENHEKTILTSSGRKGRVIIVKGVKANVTSPRILTRAGYYRYDYCFEIQCFQANGDGFYSSLTMERITADLRLLLCAIRLKHASEVFEASEGMFSRLDVLGNFKESPASKIEKYKYILIPALLFNSDYLIPLKRVMSQECRVDRQVDDLIISAVEKILDENKSEKGWYVHRSEVVKLIEPELNKIGFNYEIPLDLDKMVGVVMFALHFVPANIKKDGWVHWVNRSVINKYKEIKD
jgi:hypothetical protein